MSYIKRTYVIAAVATSSLLSLHGSGQTNIIYYGAHTNALKVEFEDACLTGFAKKTIVLDLQTCLVFWGKNSYVRTIKDGDYAAYLYNPTHCPHYPENIYFPEDIMLSDANEYALHVSQKLSDAYTNAFAFATANSNIVAAAYDFVSFVSSTNFNTVTPKQISNYVFYNQAPAILYEIGYADITNNLCYPTYYPPSILGFSYSAKGPAATNLWMLVPGSTEMFGNTEWSSFPAIWHDNKWKFCHWEDEPKYRLPPEAGE